VPVVGYDVPGMPGLMIASVFGVACAYVLPLAAVITGTDGMKVVAFFGSPVLASLGVVGIMTLQHELLPAAIMGAGALVGGAVGALVQIAIVGTNLTFGNRTAEEIAEDERRMAVAVLVPVPVGVLVGTVGGWLVARTVLDDSTPE
jgi:hypothetical protein